MPVIRLLLLAALAAIVHVSPLSAQTYKRPPVIVWDSGVHEATGGAGNKQKISLRIWQERIQHADGSYSWYFNYSVEARDRNIWGNWNYAYKLATITYSFTLTLGTTGATVTRSGTVQLNNLPASEGFLFDGAVTDPSWTPIITTATATAARYGGSSGIAVTCSH